MSLDDFEALINRLRRSSGMPAIKFDDKIKEFYYKRQTYRLIFNPCMRDDYIALPRMYRNCAYYNEVMAFIAAGDPDAVRPQNPFEE